MDESRKQFAEVFEELTGWELEDYPNQDYADTCWEFWQKSRAAIVIKLPTELQLKKYACSDCISATLDEVENAIRAAGIKVKERV
jgi:hypothetical protein